MYRYYLFDLDGTLTDPKEGITRCVQYALHSMGIEEEDLDKLVPFIGPPLIPSFMTYYGLDEDQARKAVGYYRERFSTVGLLENRVLPGIPQMLTRLREQGRILAVASSKPEPFVRRILDNFKLTDRFQEIVGATMDGSRSGKAEVIRETLRRLGLTERDAGQVLMIGDRLHDVEGARECGIRCLGVYVGYAKSGELERSGAAYIAHTVAQMEEILSGF